MDMTISGVRFMYAFVFTPRPNKMNGKTQYSVRVLIPKSNKAALDRINSTIKQVATEKWGGKAEAMLATCRLPLIDGDTKGDPVYEGFYYFNAKSDNKPDVVDLHCEPILDPAGFYSGCWGAFNGSVWAYDNAFGKGISISLQNLMKMKDDTPMTSTVSAKQAFKGLSADTDDITSYL